MEILDKIRASIGDTIFTLYKTTEEVYYVEIERKDDNVIYLRKYSENDEDCEDYVKYTQCKNYFSLLKELKEWVKE